MVVIADQSNTDVLLAALKESSEHKNVILVAAGLPNQVTINGELTDLWTKHTESSRCIRNVYQVNYNRNHRMQCGSLKICTYS